MCVMFWSAGVGCVARQRQRGVLTGSGEEREGRGGGAVEVEKNFIGQAKQTGEKVHS